MTATPDIASETAAADFLYGLAPESFVEARNQLVKELRAAGRRELAALVALLRRPTVIAGELNRVLRADPVRLEALLDAALDVRDGHQDLLDGENIDIAALQRTHRQAAMDLVDLAERNHAEIHTIVESASLDESVHDRLRAASFAVEPTPQTGFDLLTPTATVSSLADARAKREARAALAADQAASTKKRSRTARSTTSTAIDAEAESPDPEDSPALPGIGDAEEEPEPKRKRVSAKAGQKARAELTAATKARELADRRLEAATKTKTKAEDRVTKAEAQLEAARGHLAETESKYEAAVAAVDRSVERLETATAAVDELEN